MLNPGLLTSLPAEYLAQDTFNHNTQAMTIVHPLVYPPEHFINAEFHTQSGLRITPIMVLSTAICKVIQLYRLIADFIIKQCG